jgi:glycyl-tRNA synthetase beta chain
MHNDLILEIGLEEVPARFMPGALEQLEKKAQNLLNDNRLIYKSINTYGTPRRLTVLVNGLDSMQKDLIEEAKGPSKSVAFDSEGNPTKAALGFAKSRGVDIKNLVVKEIDNGEYVFAQIKKEGNKSINVLPELLKNLILSLSFPKPMRWADYQIRYVRPIRWILALYDNEVIPFSIENVNSDSITYGHRFLSKGSIKINNSDEYVSKLRDEFVIVDPLERKNIISEQIKELEIKEDGIVDKDEELLEEVNYLLE